MLFVALASSTVAVTGMYPCQRLNWAWRNVWVTCSINNLVPATTSLGGNAAFFTQSSTVANGPAFQVDNNGNFVPFTSTASQGNGPYLCTSTLSSGANIARNRCRRMLDTYGNLVNLCTMGPVKVGGITANGGTPDFLPATGHIPHTTNAGRLNFQMSYCTAGGGLLAPAPGNTCPGLSGWFNVVWNACQFTAGTTFSTPNAPAGLPNLFAPIFSTGLTAGITPSTASLPAGAPTYQMSTPGYLCGTSTTPSVGSTQATPSTGAPATSSSFMGGKGMWFRTTRCRKALDAFGRAGARCAPSSPTLVPPQVQITNGVWTPYDQLHFLAVNMASQTPFCNS